MFTSGGDLAGIATGKPGGAVCGGHIYQQIPLLAAQVCS